VALVPGLAAMALAAALSIFTAPAQAASGDWVRASNSQARLVSAVTGVGDLTTIPLGVEIKIDPEWKTYWRSPGDAGLPPQFDWAGSTNFKSAAIAWPKPHRVTLLGLQTFGYGEDVVFPISAVPTKPGAPLDIKLKLDALVCGKLCVPQTFVLNLSIPAGPATAGPDAQLIGRFQSEVPDDGRASGLTVEAVKSIDLSGMAAIEVDAVAREPFVHPDVIAEVEPAVALSSPQITLSDDGKRAKIILQLSEALPVGTSLAYRPVILTLIDGERAAEFNTKLTPAVPASQISALTSLVAMLALALVGGFILNFMPCVLPVLSIKLFSIVGSGGKAPAKIRAGFLATAAGIIASFLVLALGLIALKAAGQTIGWGIQFQEPIFIAVMIVIVTLFACNLWGFAEIPLPRFIAEGASKLDGTNDSLVSHFVTGTLATLLATPCSAPFLGTAVGFALASGPGAIIAIFLALGIGLASPYLVIAVFPRVASAMPKPGMWMLRLKQVLGFALAATAVWLLTVLAGVLSPVLAIVVGVMMLIIIALLGMNDRISANLRRPAMIGVVAVAIAALAIPIVLERGTARHDGEKNGAIAWVGFDRNQIRSLVSQGKTVFVDVTADWCLTCQANRRLAIDTPAVTQRLAGDIVPMLGDWTRPDQNIAAFLSSHGRFGIPFNIVYGPGAPSGIVLPELLSPKDVLDAIDHAALAPRADEAPNTKMTAQ
jgi:suppressor for copper-sensitivity B